MTGISGTFSRKELADAELVRRIDDRPEQADRDRLDVERAQSFGHLADRVLVEGTVGTEPSARMRSGISKVSERGTYGAGYSCV